MSILSLRQLQGTRLAASNGTGRGAGRGAGKVMWHLFSHLFWQQKKVVWHLFLPATFVSDSTKLGTVTYRGVSYSHRACLADSVGLWAQRRFRTRALVYVEMNRAESSLRKGEILSNVLRVGSREMHDDESVRSCDARAGEY